MDVEFGFFSIETFSKACLNAGQLVVVITVVVYRR